MWPSLTTIQERNPSPSRQILKSPVGICSKNQNLRWFNVTFSRACGAFDFPLRSFVNTAFSDFQRSSGVQLASPSLVHDLITSPCSFATDQIILEVVLKPLTLTVAHGERAPLDNQDGVSSAGKPWSTKVRDDCLPVTKHLGVGACVRALERFGNFGTIRGRRTSVANFCQVTNCAL